MAGWDSSGGLTPEPGPPPGPCGGAERVVAAQTPQPPTHKLALLWNPDGGTVTPPRTLPPALLTGAFPAPRTFGVSFRDVINDDTNINNSYYI